MIVLCGKTCSGKNYIRDMLVKLGIEPVVTYTTRPMRKGEIQDKTYHFLTKEYFLQKEKEGFFFESTSYNIATGETWHYGSRFEKEDDNKVIILNPDGIDALRKAHNLAVTPVVFFIDAPDAVLRERLRSRGDNMEEAENRLAIDRRDFANIAKKSDMVLKNTGVIPDDVIIQTILDRHANLLAWKVN